MIRLSILLLFVLAAIAEWQEGSSDPPRGVGTGGGAILPAAVLTGARRLRFGSKSGEFKILQVADMHYADGKETGCLDVFPDQLSTCSDLNTTAFIYRVIRHENPDFIVFTGIIFLFHYYYFFYVLSQIFELVEGNRGFFGSVGELVSGI